MKVFIDPTEQRAGTRLPDNVITHAVILKDLEKVTGADLILSPLDRPTLKELTKCPASLEALKIHCSKGVLVQRKSGNDLIGSISHLPEIQYRIQVWGLPWLLVTGEIRCSPAQKAIVNGRKSGYSYWAVIGSLDAWILRGGGVTILQKDNLIAKWLSDMSKRLSEVETPQMILPQRPRQELTRDQELNQIVATLMTLPRIGGTTAVTIARQTKGLKEALRMLGDPNILKRKDRPEGVGPKLIEEFRKIMQLKEGEGL
jgi:ERCC4-type nuclease